MRIVLDTNVLYAAFTLREGFCASLLRSAILHHELVLSSYILDELKKHLGTKGRLPHAMVEELLVALRRSAVMVTPAQLQPDACRDPDDIPVLGTAIAGKAAAIITGDRDLLELKSFCNVLLISPREFHLRHMSG